MLSNKWVNLYAATPRALDGDGATRWFARVRGASGEAMHAVVKDRAVAGSGPTSSFVGAGFFSSDATFGWEAGGGGGGMVLRAVGEWDAALWKVSSQGTTVWAIRGGGGSNSDFNYLRGATAAPATLGAVAAIASVGRISINTVTFGDVVLPGDGVTKRELLLWKVSSLGTTQWAVRAGGVSATPSAGDLLFDVAWGGDGGGAGGGYTAAESTAGWASVGGHFTAVGHFYLTAEFGPWRLTSPGGGACTR